MQPSIFDLAPRIDGPEIEPADQIRLSSQVSRVLAYMVGGEWHTLSEIARACQCSEPSASSRLRDLRKLRFGAWTVNRRRRSQAIWEYRVTR
jgi:hypothetical protein